MICVRFFPLFFVFAILSSLNPFGKRGLVVNFPCSLPLSARFLFPYVPASVFFSIVSILGMDCAKRRGCSDAIFSSSAKLFVRKSLSMLKILLLTPMCWVLFYWAFEQIYELKENWNLDLNVSRKMRRSPLTTCGNQRKQEVVLKYFEVFLRLQRRSKSQSEPSYKCQNAAYLLLNCKHAQNH